MLFQYVQVMVLRARSAEDHKLGSYRTALASLLNFDYPGTRELLDLRDRERERCGRTKYYRTKRDSESDSDEETWAVVA
jgi:hypothetical protein